MPFTKSQTQAINHQTGPCICLAGPGSGKTTIITERTKNLIENLEIPPFEILVITFTKAAALEMKERFQRLVGARNYPVTFGTFHSIFFGILKQAYRYTSANILKEEQKHQFLKEIIHPMDLEIEDESEFLQGITGEISKIKNERISLEYYYSVNCPETIFKQIYQSYQQRLERSGMLDFDDMLVYTYELLMERKDIRTGWQKRFRYLLVDEFQDINQIQYDTIRMLARPENNLFIVGDDDQSIYRFRGARPEIMLNFTKDFPDAKMILLEENFRSTENIIKGAKCVIENNTLRYPKKIHGIKEAGETIKLHSFSSQTQENTYIIKKIQDYLDNGYSHEDIAVLMRTNTGGRLLVEKFMEYNIPFCMRDAMPNIYEHWIAKNLISYINLALGSRGRKEFLQVINRPKRYIGRECLDEPIISFDDMRKYYAEKGWMIERIDKLEYDLQLLRNLAPFAAINYIRYSIGYQAYLEEYAGYRRIKAEELYEVLDELQEAAKQFKTFEEWFWHMEEYAKALKEQAKEQKKEEHAVTLTTLHSAKGLEFPVVFMIDAHEGNMPYQKAVLDVDIQEERRLFYVGMTRAREHLNIYYTKERYGKTLESSRFIEELRKTAPL